jgi:hypothetical protein
MLMFCSEMKFHLKLNSFWSNSAGGRNKILRKVVSFHFIQLREIVSKIESLSADVAP